MTEKLKNSKEVIAYIAECFPKCFTLEGEAKPLKIGIFQDLAERLNEDEKVSKTQLRAALRQYTSSWRYLHGVKPGARHLLKAKRKFKLVVKNKLRKLVKRVRRKRNLRLKSLNSLVVLTNQKYKKKVSL